MSWDKRTQIFSDLDAVRTTLDTLNVPYDESVIATFNGRGINDIDRSNLTYYLRRLSYSDKIILEYVELDSDCDVDDVIMSEEFNIEDEPDEWEAIRHTNKVGECLDEDFKWFEEEIY